MMQSIASKLWLAFVVFAIGVLAILGGFISQLFDQFYLNQQTEQLINKGEIIANLIIKEGINEKTSLATQLMSLEGPITVAVTDNIGQIITSSGSSTLLNGSKFTQAELGELNQNKTVVRNGSIPFDSQGAITVLVPVRQNGLAAKAVLVAASPTPLTNTSYEIGQLILVACLAAIGVATLLAMTASRTISRPLLQLNEAANQMIRGDFSAKIDINSGDEVGQLGRTLNILATELQDSLDDLSREKDQLANIIFSMSDGLVTFDLLGKVIQNNRPAAELLKAKHMNLAGSTLDNCCQLPQIKQLYHRTLQEEHKQRAEVSSAEGTLAVNMAPLRDSLQQITGVVMVVRDISTEQRLETMRRDFVANVSHELRTPLCLIQGYAEALEDGLASDQQTKQEMTGIIKEETNRLQRLINDLLDIAKIESGKLELKLGQVDLGKLLEQAAHPFRPLARERNIDLLVQVGRELPPITGDEDRLTQVLINLLDNAFRFTPIGGRIELTAHRKAEGIELRLADTGSGIPAEAVPHLFERFYKVDKARSRGTAGTGLGLAIVRSIIQAHGGIIRVESELGRGTSFIIQLTT